MEAYRVDWLDSSSWGDKWEDYEELDIKKLSPITTRGTVVKETSDTIFLAQSTSHDQCHNIIGIPKGCILKQRKIP